MTKIENLKKDLQLPSRPDKEDFTYIYAYRKGKVHYEGTREELLGELSPVVSHKERIPEDQIWFANIERYLNQEHVIEEVLNEEKWNAALEVYESSLIKFFNSTVKLMCSEEYLGIRNTSRVKTLFELSCEQCKDEGKIHSHYLESVIGKFLTYCRVMKAYLRPLPGCYNPNREEANHLFSHNTDFNCDEREFTGKINRFLKENKHTVQDQEKIALAFYNSAVNTGRFSCLPDTLVNLARNLIK